MRRVFHVLLAVLLVGFFAGGPSGCGKEPGKPNPDLKVPDVPPGGHGARDAGMKDPGKRQPGKK
jgi:hypothetical protein